MGTTFSSMQVKNKLKAEPQLFKKALCKYFEKKGFVCTDEDNSQFSYRLVFSDKSDWVILNSPEYEPGAGAKNIREDADGIAKTLKTHCITTSVWDSDFIELELFGSTAAKRDSVVIGRHVAEDFPTPKGNPEHWESLLENGATWEQLSEVFNSDHTFIEDSLSDIAPLLGMDGGHVTADYETLNGIPESPYVFDLYFAKAQSPSAKKPISLNTAFKQVFGEALEPLGFKLIKSKYPYFVRVVEGGDIIHVVTFYKGHPLDNYFNILSGVATVYRQRITLDESPSYNSIWLHRISYYYHKLHLSDKNSKYSLYDLDRFLYCTDKPVIHSFTGKLCEHSPIQAMEYALEVTTEIVLPILDRVADLDSCIEYFHRFGPGMNLNYGVEDFGNKFRDNFCNEGLLRIISSEYESYCALIEKGLEKYLFTILNEIKSGRSGRTMESYEEERKRYEDGKSHRAAHLKKIFNDYDWVSKAQSERKRRRDENLETLKSYGLDV
ncbi:MAG: hypothetical protein FWG70_11680 [Oscillospiraceae bacterium]|nr:hypothetical protein [Oscillospiraceae bacterium]